MSEPGTRPGGLTALAIINFVFAAWGLIVAAGVFFAPIAISAGIKHAEMQADRKAKLDREAETRGAETRSAEELAREEKGLKDMREAEGLFKKHPTMFMLVGVMGVVISALLLLSGIGYLKLKRGLGRTVGTIYALVTMAWEVCGIVFAAQFGDRSFGLANMIGFIYPLITLFTLHRVFKDDFVNP
jgi:hypothetical protein